MGIFDRDNTRVVRSVPELIYDNKLGNNAIVYKPTNQSMVDGRDWSTRLLNKGLESPIGRLYSDIADSPVNFVLPTRQGMTNLVSNQSSVFDKASGALEVLPAVGAVAFKGIKPLNRLVDKALNGNKYMRSNKLIDDIGSLKMTEDAMNNAISHNVKRIDAWRSRGVQGLEVPIQPMKNIDQYNSLHKRRLIDAVQNIRSGMERKGYPKKFYKQFNPALANDPNIAKKEIIKALKRDNTFVRGTTLVDGRHESSVLGLIDRSKNPDDITHNIFDIDSYKRFQLESIPPYNTGGGRYGMEGLKRKLDSGILDGNYNSNHLGAGKGYAIRDDFTKDEYGNLGIVRKRLNLSGNNPLLWIERNDPSKYYNVNDGYNMKNPIGGMIKDVWNPVSAHKPSVPKLAKITKSYKDSRFFKNDLGSEGTGWIDRFNNHDNKDNYFQTPESRELVRKLWWKRENALDAYPDRILTDSERQLLENIWWKHTDRFNLDNTVGLKLSQADIPSSIYSMHDDYKIPLSRMLDEQKQRSSDAFNSLKIGDFTSPEELKSLNALYRKKEYLDWKRDYGINMNKERNYKLKLKQYNENPNNENLRPFAHYIIVDKPGEQVSDVIKLFDKKSFDKIKYEKGMRNNAANATRGLSLAGMFGLSTADQDSTRKSIFDK